MTKLADMLTALLYWEYIGELCVAITLFWPVMIALTTLELWKKDHDGRRDH